MRSYSDNKINNELEIKDIVCNCCGKKLSVKNGVVTEGYIKLEIPFGYFSKKDGQIHCFDLCEECYDSWIKTFKISVEIQDRTELL